VRYKNYLDLIGLPKSDKKIRFLIFLGIRRQLRLHPKPPTPQS